ncbi:hypothetical protein B0A49_06344 [Cryomyces minteri]|uniref:AAA+ ATPase domain-containing protein n=1 Tax=Cryomyces minteri TaxID=331657 RepID=A0A4U0X5Y9_9PEZI|nr:hypothetical protein B0A49_06344 [Cryomyces minteri]
METARKGEQPVEEVETEQIGEPSVLTTDLSTKDAATPAPLAKKKTKCKVDSHHKRSKKSKKSKKAKGKKPLKDSSSPSTSATDETEDDTDDKGSSSSSDDSSEDDKAKRKEHKRKALRKRSKGKKHRKSKKYESSSSGSDTSSDDESTESESSSEEEVRRKKRKSKKPRRHVDVDTGSGSSGEGEVDDGAAARANADEYLATLNAQRSTGLYGGGQRITLPHRSRLRLNTARAGLGSGLEPYNTVLDNNGRRQKKLKKRIFKRAGTLEYKRVDQLWDSTIHNYQLRESAANEEDEFDQYVFTVRRKFDWENKYRNTVVDIKSKLLREALAEVMKDVKGVSLVEDQPCLDPNMLFLYLEELRTHAKKTLKAKAKKEKKRKNKRQLAQQIAHCKIMIKYLDEDYAETKKTLYPLLEAGNITFDLLWALFKPNSIAYTAAYGSTDDPRCFKVDYANKECSFTRGEWYCIEGRYLEYDGKNFGLGDFEIHVESFKGPRKITGLVTYPLKYHKDPEGLTKHLIERGRRFVDLEGMNYRFHKGLAFMKKKKAILKVTINGRIMIDPAIFRRINPNYPISLIKLKDPDEGSDDSSDDRCSCCDNSESSDQDTGAVEQKTFDEPEEKEKTKVKVVYDEKEKTYRVVEVPVDEDGKEVQVENLDKLPGGEPPEDATKTVKREFTEEELLIASPVVLGFAFSEKLWLEFSLSGVRDIEWNEGAFESLVLPPNQKSIVKALVESHKFHAAKTIDDVVQGKGKGLVAVLHGPPGTGKTLTAEGIAELLKCPLYMVSAGELGTDPARLEHELQKILDIAHSWGAVLLLDEADVFLEKREVHDIHRNALVSIFLRLLEYFQGILFLTTNRVETFDDAFQSRIHVALRYGELTTKAKKAVWKLFLEKVRAMEGVDTIPFKDSDYDTLARHSMNGRQIKNAVRTAQALAVNESTKLSMEHIKRVLDVAQSFDRDLKGGTGYEDAMRNYL